MGDRIAVMRDGVIVQCDAPMAIYDRPATQFVGGFIGSPPMNFLRGTIVGGVFEGDGFQLPVDGAPAQDGPVVLGIRAEHLAIGPAGVPAKVQVVEPLGSHALITTLVGKTPVKIQAPVDSPVKPNDQVRLSMDRSRIRWMDGNSGAALDAPR